MSLWPEHPYHQNAEYIRKQRKALFRLAVGPVDKEVCLTIVLSVWNEHTNEATTTEFYFPRAIYEYYPDPGYPAHLLVWTPSSSHVFDYHDINHVMVNHVMVNK
jgi:hypothetical protein